MANRALGNADGVNHTEGGVSLTAISSAVDAINNVFDECKLFVGWDVAPCPPAQVSKASTAITGLMVKVYPNPSKDAFNLSLTTASESKVSIAVYDMLGRLIDTRDLDPKEFTEVKIGERYPSGIYNVIVTQGTEIKTQRVIKE